MIELGDGDGFLGLRATLDRAGQVAENLTVSLALAYVRGGAGRTFQLYLALRDLSQGLAEVVAIYPCGYVAESV